MGEVVPDCSSPTLHPPITSHCSVIILFRSVLVQQLSWLALLRVKRFFINSANKQIIHEVHGHAIVSCFRCIFVPDNGAFFVNYVITSAFIGCAADLARLTELFSYAVKLMCARSAAEKTSVRKVGGRVKPLHPLPVRAPYLFSRVPFHPSPPNPHIYSVSSRY